MNKFMLLLLILFVVCGCRAKKHVGDEYPFRRGFEFVPWGAAFTTVDSAIAKDSAWERISSVDNSDTGGQILVIRGKHREYYLEFDRKDRFFMVNYISDSNDVDTVTNYLKRHYGEPEHGTKGSEAYQELLWNVEADSIHLEIQMLVTQRQYALKVLNKRIQ